MTVYDEAGRTLLLTMPADHRPDWDAATAFIDTMSIQAIDRFAQRFEFSDAELTPDAALNERGIARMRDRLYQALTDLRAAIEGTAPYDNPFCGCERRTIDDAIVLIVDLPFSDTAAKIWDAVFDLDFNRVLDVLGMESPPWQAWRAERGAI